jgi:hypothetical protein
MNLLAAIMRAIGPAPRETPIEDNAPATIIGRVKAIGEPLEAPLSGKPCVAFAARARTLVRSSVGNRWHCTAEHGELRLVPFVLVTRSGDVVVDSQFIDLIDQPTPLLPRRLDRQSAFLAKLDVTSGQRFSFDEVIVEPGMKIVVKGIAQIEVDPAPTGESGFRDTPTRIRLTGDEARPLTIDRA